MKIVMSETKIIRREILFNRNNEIQLFYDIYNKVVGFTDFLQISGKMDLNLYQKEGCI